MTQTSTYSLKAWRSLFCLTEQEQENPTSCVLSMISTFKSLSRILVVHRLPAEHPAMDRQASL